MKNRILIANWKMNPATEVEAVKLARASDSKDVVICPPFPFLRAIKQSIKKAALGAQDVFWEEKGAYTGEVAPTMLKKLGVRYVIIGHSERRRWAGQTDEMVNKKVKAAIKVSLQPILCVGEPLAVRKKGLVAAKQFVQSQLRRDFLNPTGIIITYEPIWAISRGFGTGTADNPDDAHAMIQFIKKFLYSKFHAKNVRVLYGGSVTSLNIGRILEYNEIDGALVGGASLKSAEFKKIIKTTSKYNGNR